MFAHDDFIRGQGDEGAPGHGVVGDKHGDLAFMLLQGPGDLGGGEHQAARGMEHQVNGHVVAGEVNGPEDFLGVINVDVTENGKAQQSHGFLAVDQENHPGRAFLLHLQNQAFAGEFHELLSEEGLQGNED